MDWQSLKSTARSVPDELASRIEQLIISRTVQAGEFIPPERELAKLLGVSRSSVRDAMRDLELRGLIDRRPGRGTVVVSHDNPVTYQLSTLINADRRDLANVMELRAVIEPPIAARAAARCLPDDVRRLEAIVDRMHPEMDHEEFTQADRQFHMTIARVTRNPLLISLVEAMNDMTDRSRAERWRSAARIRSSTIEHRAILDAIRARDSAAAEKAAADHVESVRAVIASTDSTE